MPMKTCPVEGCEKTLVSRGTCEDHFRRCGHPKSDSNSYYSDWFTKAGVKRVATSCRECHQARYRSKPKLGKSCVVEGCNTVVFGQGSITCDQHFACGHPKTKENSSGGKAKYPTCGVCTLAYERKRARELGIPKMSSPEFSAKMSKIHLKGKEPSYPAIHKRARTVLPRVCAHCGATKNLQCALKDGVPEEYLRFDPRPVTRSWYSIRGKEDEDYMRLCVSCHREYDDLDRTFKKNILKMALMRRVYKGESFGEEIVDKVIEDNWETLEEFKVGLEDDSGHKVSERTEAATIMATILVEGARR